MNIYIILRILTFIRIAMKFYLLPFLFFLFLSGWAGSSCAQEHLQNETSSPFQRSRIINPDK